MLKWSFYRLCNFSNRTQFLIPSSAFVELEHHPASHCSLNHYHLLLSILILLCTSYATLIFFPVERISSLNHEALFKVVIQLASQHCAYCSFFIQWFIFFNDISENLPALLLKQTLCAISYRS